MTQIKMTSKDKILEAVQQLTTVYKQFIPESEQWKRRGRPLFTISEIAGKCGLSTSTVRKWVIGNLNGDTLCDAKKLTYSRTIGRNLRKLDVYGLYGV